jgi:hypothetical protein
MLLSLVFLPNCCTARPACRPPGQESYPIISQNQQKSHATFSCFPTVVARLGLPVVPWTGVQVADGVAALAAPLPPPLSAGGGAARPRPPLAPRNTAPFLHGRHDEKQDQNYGQNKPYNLYSVCNLFIQYNQDADNTLEY